MFEGDGLICFCRTDGFMDLYDWDGMDWTGLGWRFVVGKIVRQTCLLAGWMEDSTPGPDWTGGKEAMYKQ